MHQAQTKHAQLEQQSRMVVSDLTQRLNEAVRIGTELHTQYKTLNEAGNIASKAGLTNDEHMQAVQFASEAKRDPVTAIKKLLTLAATRGIDLTQIGLQPGAVDPKSLVAHI